MPFYDVREYHEIEVEAPVRAIFRGRELLMNAKRPPEEDSRLVPRWAV